MVITKHKLKGVLHCHNCKKMPSEIYTIKVGDRQAIALCDNCIKNMKEQIEMVVDR